MKFYASAPGGPQDTLEIGNSDNVADIAERLSRCGFSNDIRFLVCGRRAGPSKNMRFQALCPNLEKVTLLSNVRTVGADAFYGCSNLSEIVFSEGLTTIKNRAFSHAALRSVRLPKTIQTIEPNAFSSNENLAEITIPEDAPLKEIPNSFARLTAITGFVCPRAVQTIKSHAFFRCGQMTSVTLNEGLSSISGSAFAHAGLTSLTLPSSLLSFGDSYMPDLYSVGVAPTNECIHAVNGMLFNNENSLICCPPRKTADTGALTLPEGTFDIRCDLKMHKIKRLFLPASFRSASSGDFFAERFNTELEVIAVAHDHPAMRSIDGIVYSKEGAALLYYPPAHKGDVFLLPRKTAKITSRAFFYARLKKVIFTGPITLEQAAFTRSEVEVCVFHAPARGGRNPFNYTSVKQVEFYDIVGLSETTFFGCSAPVELVFFPESQRKCVTDMFRTSYPQPRFLTI